MMTNCDPTTAEVVTPTSHRHNRGAVLEAPLDFRCHDWPLEVGAEDVVLRVELCGLCGTDVHTARGENSRARFPALLGHEIVGRLAACPAGTTDMLGRPLELGDSVVLASASFGECQRCYVCTVLRAPWQCSGREATDVRVGSMDVTVVGGGLARFVRLSTSRRARLLATGVSPPAAVLHEPLSVAVRTVRAGPSILGQDVVVQGTGAIGLLTVLVARVSGAARIIAVGGPAARLDRATELGATHCVNIGELSAPHERIEAVLRATLGGFGAAVVYEVAGVPEAVTEGLNFLRPGGVLLEAGNATNTGTTDFAPHSDLQAGSRTLVGVRGVRTEDFVVALRLLERFEDDVSALVTHRMPLDRVGDGIAAMQDDYRLDDCDVIKVAIDPFAAERAPVGAPGTSDEA